MTCTKSTLVILSERSESKDLRFARSSRTAALTTPKHDRIASTPAIHDSLFANCEKYVKVTPMHATRDCCSSEQHVHFAKKRLLQS
jgi:hypothetical protein